MKRFAKPAAVLFWLLVWQAVAMIIGSDIILVTPIKAAARLIELIPEKSFRAAVLGSLFRITLGFFTGLVIGCSLAVLSFMSTAAKTLISPLMSAVKSVPVASFVILALFWMGGKSLSVLISALMTVPIVYANVLEGLGNTDKKLLEAAKVFSMTGMRKARLVYLPAVMPHLVSACRTAVGISFKSGTAAEVIVQTSGSVGDMLYRAKLYLETADLFAYTFVIILSAKLIELIVIKILRSLFRLTQKI